MAISNSRKTASIYVALCAVFMCMASAAYAFDENWIQCLGGLECGICEKDPSHKNPWGYLGFYQMGVNYASESVCANAGDLPLMNVNQDWDLFKERCVLSAWARSQGINSHDDWMQGGNPPNPARAKQLQTAMLIKNSEATWTRIQKNLGQYIGQTINGIEMTKETMVAMAHLKGYGGLKKTLEGDVDVKDGNGTSTLSYASCLNGCLENDGKKGDCKFTVSKLCGG